MTTIRLTDDRDSLKALRETLVAAQSGLVSFLGANREIPHIERLERLVAEIDRQRPLGPDGKHGDRHTVTCGCSDKPPVSEGTGHVWPCTRFYVSASVLDQCTCWRERA